MAIIQRAPTARGVPGRGGGREGYVATPREWRGTTVQACGLWPFSAGAGSPMLGVPLGRHIDTGATVCFDPVTWFRHRLISNSGMFLLGLPGLGKSTLLRRLVLGVSAFGVRPLILGDLKPDYADLITALGGQVIRLGRGLGALNPLDPGALGQAATRLSGAAADLVGAQVRGRQLTAISGLINIVRKRPPTDHEGTVLSTALRVLADRHDGVPLVADLVKVLDDAPSEIRAVTLDRGSDDRYREQVDPLHRSLLAVLDGPLGDVFARPTTTHLDLDAPGICVDVSGIGMTDTDLIAATLLQTWNAGFAAVAGSQALTDAGLAPQRNFFVVIDELWRVLRVGPGMADHTDAATRTGRNDGYGLALCTHTFHDLRALPTAEDRAKARGLAERCAVTVSAGLPPGEISNLRDLVDISRAEAQRITSWSDPAPWDNLSGTEATPPGLGKVLIKVGGKPGIPVQIELTPQEKALNDTNRRWQMAGHKR